jgi:uncharacterized protein YhdP
MSSAAGVSLASTDAPGGGSGSAQGYFPTVMAVRANELIAGGRTFQRVVIGGSRDGMNWRANVSADQLNGYVEYRQPSGAGDGRVYARLSRLALAPAAARDVEELLDKQPTSIPALDIVVDDFELRGKKLGRVEIEAINRGAGSTPRESGPREWRLNKLNFTMPEASLSASGAWAAVATGSAGAPAPQRRDGDRRRNGHELPTRHRRCRHSAGASGNERRDSPGQGKDRRPGGLAGLAVVA